MAWDESLTWRSVLSNFILLGQELEQVGFTYYKGAVAVIDIKLQLF